MAHVSNLIAEDIELYLKSHENKAYFALLPAEAWTMVKVP